MLHDNKIFKSTFTLTQMKVDDRGEEKPNKGSKTSFLLVYMILLELLIFVVIFMSGGAQIQVI